MSPVLANRHIAVLSQQRMSTRALTCLTLVMLLLFGVAGIGHHESNGHAEAGTSAHSVTSDIYAPATTAESASTYVNPSSGELALAVCAIGLICVLVGLLVTRNLLGSHPAARLVRHSPLTRSIAPSVSLPPRTPSRTLLCVSRI